MSALSVEVELNDDRRAAGSAQYTAHIAYHIRADIIDFFRIFDKKLSDFILFFKSRIFLNAVFAARGYAQSYPVEYYTDQYHK